jgi:hypothetical protein
LANTCPTEDSEKEMKKQVGCAMLNLRQKRGKMLSTEIKEQKCRFGPGIESSVGFSV